MDFRAGWLRGMDRSVATHSGNSSLQAKRASKPSSAPQIPIYSEKFLARQKRAQELREEARDQALNDPVASRHSGVQVHAIPPSIAPPAPHQKTSEYKTSRPSTPVAKASRMRASSGASTGTSKKATCDTSASTVSAAAATEKVVLTKTAQKKRDAERAAQFTRKRVAAIETARQLASPQRGRGGAAALQAGGVHAHGYSQALRSYRASNTAPSPSLNIDLAAVSPVPMTKLMSMRQQQQRQQQQQQVASVTGEEEGKSARTGRKPAGCGSPRLGRMSIIEASVSGMYRPDGHDQRHHTPSSRRVESDSASASAASVAAVKVNLRPWLSVSPKADMFGQTWRPKGATSPALSLHACVNQQVVEVADRKNFYHSQAHMLQQQQEEEEGEEEEEEGREGGGKGGQAYAAAGGPSQAQAAAEGWAEEKHGEPAPAPLTKKVQCHMHSHHLRHERPSFAPHYLPTSAHAHDDIMLRESAFLKRAKAALKVKYGSGRGRGSGRARSADSASKEEAEGKAAVYANIRRVVAAEAAEREEETGAGGASAVREEPAPPSPSLARPADASVLIQTGGESEAPSAAATLSPTPAAPAVSPKQVQSGAVYIGERCVHLSPTPSDTASPTGLSPAAAEEQEAAAASKISPFSPAPVRPPKSANLPLTPQDDGYLDDFEEEEEEEEEGGGVGEVGGHAASPQQQDKVSPFSPLPPRPPPATTETGTETEADKISPFSPAPVPQAKSQAHGHKQKTHKGGHKKGKR